MRDDLAGNPTARVMTAEEAVSLVRPGDSVMLGFSHAQPPALIRELVRQRERFVPPVVVWTGAASFGSFDFAAAEHAEFFRTRLVHPGQLQQAVSEGSASYVPIDNVDLCRLLDQRLVRCDVALVHVSPPDERGHCSLGLSVGPVQAMIRAADRVIAQVNPLMPVTGGEASVPLSSFDAVIEAPEPLMEWKGVGRPPSDVERAIGANVARLVPDGATLQVGIGSLADAVLQSLTGRRDLRFRSGLVSDGARELAEAGALDRSVDAPIRTGSVIGSRSLYAWADRNPMLALETTETLHRSASRDSAFTAVNSALEVDLTGQVNVESLAGRLVGGVGGQLRFMLSAGDSPGGRAILALPSTSRDGRFSRIKARLVDVPIGTPRSAVHYVVTEHGVADLQGLSLEERAIELARIADAKFRDALLREWHDTAS